MSDEELLLEQCARLKALNPDLRCFVYRNLIKALPWYSSVRALVNDPTHAGWFLKSKPGGPFGNGSFYVDQCDRNWSPPRCSPLYKDVEQTPGYPHGDGACPGPCDCGGVPCGVSGRCRRLAVPRVHCAPTPSFAPIIIASQSSRTAPASARPPQEYLWDHRNATLRSWIINEFILGANGLGNPNVSGFFLDDEWSNTTGKVAPWMPQPYGFCNTYSAIGGPTEENFHCVDDMGLTQADTTAITDQWAITNGLVHQVLMGAGAWSWQQFTGWSTPSAAQCASELRTICTAGAQWNYYGRAVYHDWTTNGTTSPLPQPALDIATFLLVRGPHWWLGYGWVGCGVSYDFPDALSVDYGEPVGTCAETAPNSNVFQRSWTKATARVDCNAMEGSVTMTSGAA